MITQKQYKQNSEKYWLGKKVRLLRDYMTGEKAYTAGMEFRIERKYAGFDIHSVEICPHCGVGMRHWLRRVAPTDLELVQEPANAAS